MGLRDLVANGVALANSLTADLQVSVQLEQWTGQDAFGNATYAAAVSYTAIVEKVNKRIMTPSGVEQHINYYIAVIQPITANGASGRQEPIDTRDKITLSDGATGPIRDHRGLLDSDTDSPYLMEVWLG